MRLFPVFIFLLVLFTRCNFSEPEFQVNKKLPAPDQTLIESGTNNSPERPGSSSNDQKQHIEESGNPKYSGSKKRKSRNVNQDLPEQNPLTDTSRIEKIEMLRKGRVQVDLNEPISRGFMLSPIKNGKYASMILLSREKFLRISFDNDILDYTDRFYTNGIRFDFISPAFQQFPLSKLMIPYWNSGINYYGISLVQNMYTPSTTKQEGILFGDRPYAAYLFLGMFKISNDPVNKFRQTSELDIGVIGSYSFGEYIQKSFHNEVPTNSTPLGWEYQIKNDLVLNYHLIYEKGIYNSRNIDLNLTGTGSLGTLYTNISGGFHFRAGMQNPYFINLGQTKRSTNRELNLRNTQLYFFITSRGKLVGYDATLQGGCIDKSSVYTISSNKISKFVYQGSAGITFVYGGIRLDVEQYILSPEFHGGWWHKWVHLAFTFSL